MRMSTLVTESLVSRLVRQRSSSHHPCRVSDPRLSPHGRNLHLAGARAATERLQVQPHPDKPIPLPTPSPSYIRVVHILSRLTSTQAPPSSLHHVVQACASSCNETGHALSDLARAASYRCMTSPSRGKTSSESEHKDRASLRPASSDIARASY